MQPLVHRPAAPVPRIIGYCSGGYRGGGAGAPPPDPVPEKKNVNANLRGEEAEVGMAWSRLKLKCAISIYDLVLRPFMQSEDEVIAF